MGGKGSGRPPKEKEFEVDLDEGFTSFEEKPPEKKETKKVSGKKFGVGEVQEKIYLIFSAVARVTKRKNTLTEKDFSAEAAGVVRLAEKFPIVFHALSLFDPVMVVLGLWQKFSSMDKKQEQQPQQQQNNVLPMAGVR